MAEKVKIGKVAVIACGVLGADLRHISERLGRELEMDFLPGGLHEDPPVLRQRVQEKVDQLSADESIERIVLGYGVCGRGTVGIRAGRVPLVIPRVHDCIALFLGSDKAYQEQFRKFPGTYYISKGWMLEKVQPASQEEKVNINAFVRNFEQIEEKHGREKAEHVRDFMNSWRRNYQRAVFIRTPGQDDDRSREYAQGMARECGWRFEQLEGSSMLLEKAITATQSDDDVLVVPPGYETVFDAVRGRINAAPLSGDAGRWLRNRVEVIRTEGGGNGQAVKIGLGIDAGGTYTDAVVYDFEHRRVLERSKALTTRWDFKEGISEALQGLERDVLARAELVSISTTLATNAIVEGHGQTVGLLVMPPYGIYDPSDISHSPKAALSARMDIDGREIEAVDESQVRRTAREMINQHGVRAFAVSGFASTVNPEHELTVKRILRDEFGLGVTCGHELSEMLNFRTRAVTAVLNARIIPILQRFLEEMRQTLDAFGIRAPMTVVKGDGTLMGLSLAMERPVETILSGPAASAAGARQLTGLDEALVVDIGGTTTDTASLRGGAVRTCQGGTSVGGHHTHVRALDMRTRGLGGDSLIALVEMQLRIGPGRVAPMAWLAQKWPAVHEALEMMVHRVEHYWADTRVTQFAVRTSHSEPLDLTDREKRILEILSERPRPLDELAHLSGDESWSLLNLSRLREHSLVQLCGLTPTDLLHVRGDFVRWDAEASRLMCRMMSRILHVGVSEFIRMGLERFEQDLALELLKKMLDEHIEVDRIEHEETADRMIRLWLDGTGRDVKVSFSSQVPIVGIGAPAGLFLPGAARRLQARAVIPEHADVANAVGAITSMVEIVRHVRIRPDEEAGFVIEGLAGAEKFEDFDRASDYARQILVESVREQALRAGTSHAGVETITNDEVVTTSWGTELFMGRSVTAKISGRPDIKLLGKNAV